MASPAQVIANNGNAQHSTGPKTAEGKAASSRNAASHGLSSSLTVLAHEDQAEFDEFVDCLHEEHQPANPHQVFLVYQLAISTWQLARAQRLQTKAFDYLAAENPETVQANDPDARIIARMFKTNPNVLATLQRYTAQAERSYYKAYNELKIAKQIQDDAGLVKRLDSGQVGRIINAPMPNHPLYASQYGNPKERPAQNTTSSSAGRRSG